MFIWFTYLLLGSAHGCFLLLLTASCSSSLHSSELSFVFSHHISIISGFSNDLFFLVTNSFFCMFKVFILLSL